jgi:hypothetical protein
LAIWQGGVAEIDDRAASTCGGFQRNSDFLLSFFWAGLAGVFSVRTNKPKIKNNKVVLKGETIRLLSFSESGRERIISVAPTTRLPNNDWQQFITLARSA